MRRPSSRSTSSDWTFEHHVQHTEAATEAEQRDAEQPDRFGEGHAEQRQHQCRHATEDDRTDTLARDQQAGQRHPGQRADAYAQQQHAEQGIAHLDPLAHVGHQRRPYRQSEAGDEEPGPRGMAHDGCGEIGAGGKH